MSNRSNTYVGVDNDINGGMTSIGKMIRDAWVFELLPEDETCEGWNQGALNALLQKVNTEWDKYGCLVSKLPPGLAERHQRIHDVAIVRARETGWSGEHETGDDD